MNAQIYRHDIQDLVSIVRDCSSSVVAAFDWLLLFQLYIIVFHPERNVRQSMMPKMSKVPTTIKSSAVTASTAVRPAVPSAAIATPGCVGAHAAPSAPSAACQPAEKLHKATQSDDAK